jgi:hypothetical protein
MQVAITGGVKSGPYWADVMLNMQVLKKERAAAAEEELRSKPARGAFVLLFLPLFVFTYQRPLIGLCCSPE